MIGLTDQTGYKKLVAYISKAYSQGQQKAVQAINSNLLNTYWQKIYRYYTAKVSV